MGLIKIPPDFLNNKNQVSIHILWHKEGIWLYKSLNHIILLEKVNNAGITGKGLELLRSDLYGRKIHVDGIGHVSGRSPR